MRVLRYGSAIFVAGAGDREVARCDGIVRLRVVVEVNVAVTLGVACERALFGGAGIAKLLGRALLDVCAPMGVPA